MMRILLYYDRLTLLGSEIEPNNCPCVLTTETTVPTTETTVPTTETTVPTTETTVPTTETTVPTTETTEPSTPTPLSDFSAYKVR